MGFEFKKAQREKVKLRIAFGGVAGSGKTVSSLKLAYGITGDWGKIAVIDSEQGRALYYANRSDLGIGEFLHCELSAPFSVDRYIEAMETASEIVGSDGVVIIDSISPAWSSEGGVLAYKEQIAQQRGKNDFSSWQDASKLQNRLIRSMMELPCHAICTLRSKANYVTEVNEETGKTSIKKLGSKMEQREGFDYEMAIVFNLDKDSHVCQIEKDNTILDAEGFYGVITPEVGRRLKAWASEGVEAKVYTCECCGKKIKTYAFDDGTVMSPQEIVEKSKESYGKAMCMDCVFEQNVETESEEESVVEEEENTEE